MCMKATRTLDSQVDAGSLRQVEKPGPGWAGFDPDLDGTKPIQQVDEAIGLGVGDASGPVHEISSIVHNGDDGKSCVSVNSCDEHGWPP